MKFTFKCDICHQQVKGGKKFELESYEKEDETCANGAFIAESVCRKCHTAFVGFITRLARKARKAGA